MAGIVIVNDVSLKSAPVHYVERNRNHCMKKFHIEHTVAITVFDNVIVSEPHTNAPAVAWSVIVAVRNSWSPKRSKASMISSG